MYQRIKQWAKSIKKDILVVWLIAKDKRTPNSVKLLALIIAAYAFSPIDLIPDFIPVLGVFRRYYYCTFRYFISYQAYPTKHYR